MATAGPSAPGTMANTGTGRNWISPDNAKISDNSYTQAYTTLGGNATSKELVATNFGFAIPSGATINGITVRIERKCDIDDASHYGYDNTVKLVKGGVYSGNNKASASHWPTSDAVATYGGSADLWGNTLTYSDVNASNFGVVLVGNIVDTDFSPALSVDFISIEIDYTAAGGGGVTKQQMHYSRLRR